MSQFLLRCGALAGVALAASLHLAGAPAHAAVNNIEDVGATERINYSGKLRMLSQRIAAASCNYTAGVAPDVSKSMLTAAGVEFEKIVNGLARGDVELRIKGQETRRKTLAAIAALRGQWEPIKTAVDRLVADGPSAEATAVIDQGNMGLLSKAKLLVSELSGQYSDPSAMNQANAMLVDISGRQRMLSQKMSKEACLIWSAGGDPMAQEALGGTMQMFELSLLALRDGMPSAGINAAPTDEIATGLSALWTDWTAIKPGLQQAVEGVMLDGEARAEMLGKLNTALKDMNTVVGLYTVYAKSGL